MTSKVERLEHANSTLTRELRERESEIKRMSVRSTLDKDFKKAHTLEAKLRDACRTVEDLEGELVSQREKASKLQYEVDILRSVVQLRDHPELLRVADAEVRSRKLDQELRAVKEELVGTSEKCKVYYEGCAKAAKEADSLRYKCSQLQDELDRQSRDMKELLVEREGFVREVNDVTEQSSNLHQHLDELNTTNGRLEQLMRERDRKIVALEGEVRNLTVDESNARRTWEEGHRLFLSTSNELKEVQADRDQLRLKLHHLQEEEHVSNRRLESLNRSVESLRAENKQMRDQVAQWQSRSDEIEALGRRLAVADADESKKLHRIATLEEECSNLMARVADKERHSQVLGHELGVAREDLAVQNEQMNVLSRNLMSRLERVEGERDAALEGRDGLEKELRAALEKISTLTVLVTHHQSLNRAALGVPNAPSNAIPVTSERLQRLLSDTAITSRPSSQHVSPPRLPLNSSDIALSPPTPLPSSGDHTSHSLRSRLERLSR